MQTFHALTDWKSSSLYIWRLKLDVQSKLPALERDAHDFAVFRGELDHQIHESTLVKLFSADEWEKDAYNRALPRFEEYRFPSDMWLVQDTNRVLPRNPFETGHDAVRVHLVTAKKYRKGSLYQWTPGVKGELHAAEGEDEYGPIFRVPLAGRNRHLFAFKFVDQGGNFEPDYANKLWCSLDGPEVWVHSQAAHVSTMRPVRKKLTVHFLAPGRPAAVPGMHLWQADSDFAADIDGQPDGENGYLYECEIYTGRPYGFKFYWSTDGVGSRQWEHDEATRNIALHDDRAVWTLEGDHELFDAAPVADRKIVLEIAARPPSCRLGEPLMLDVWVNHS